MRQSYQQSAYQPIYQFNLHLVSKPSIYYSHAKYINLLKIKLTCVHNTDHKYPHIIKLTRKINTINSIQNIDILAITVQFNHNSFDLFKTS